MVHAAYTCLAILLLHGPSAGAAPEASCSVAGNDTDTPDDHQLLLQHGVRLQMGPHPHSHSAPNASALCMVDRMVPQFYLLGAQKCGTSTLAKDLMTAGMLSGIGTKKELHSFRRYCIFRLFRSAISQCKVLSELDKIQWAAQFSKNYSSDVKSMIADMTPVNLRLPGLPETLKALYGANHTQLRYSFPDYVDRIVARASEFAKSQAWEDMAVDLELDGLYRSMYSLNLAPWLQAFDARQFVILPMKYYVSSLSHRHATIAHIQTQLGVQLNLAAVIEPTHANVGKHAKLGEDLAAETIDSLHQRFFDSDARRLGELLADGMKGGLTIVGYDGHPEAAEVQRYLSHNW